MSPDRLRAHIGSILHLADSGDSSIGGLDTDGARDLMDAIAGAGLDDDDALRAYDVCHAIATYGRAF